MIPRQFQMMVGPLPFVRIRAIQFQDDWANIQLSSANTQLNGILHSFVIPATSFVAEDYPEELVAVFMGYLSGDLSEETKEEWIELMLLQAKSIFWKKVSNTFKMGQSGRCFASKCATFFQYTNNAL